MHGDDFAELMGKTLTNVIINDDNTEVLFHCSDGSVYQMYHEQDCCETVWLEDVAGEMSDLIGEPILLAEAVSNSDDPIPEGAYGDSYTWTFYKLATNRGYVTLRWFGESNGYYSEEVTFSRIEDAA